MGEKKPPSGLYGTKVLSNSMPNMDQILPLIKKEGELHKLLTDEKMRSDKHRSNYISLKQQFEKLQQDFGFLRDNRSLYAGDFYDKSSKDNIAKYQKVIQKLQSEISQKQTEIDDLKKFSLTPEKYDSIKSEIVQELHVPFKQRLDQIEDELNDYRSRYNALRHDYTFLKSEYDFAMKENERTISDMENKLALETEHFAREKEEILRNFGFSAEKESSKVKNLLKENAHLTHRVKSLEQTIEEKDAQAENRTDASDHVSRYQANQLIEQNGKIKILEATNSSLKSQVENMEVELKKSNNFNSTQNENFLQVEKENLILKNKIEEIRHEESMSKNNQKIESMITYNEIVKERDALRAELEEIATKFEAANHVIEKQKTAIGQKEREITRRVQSAKDSDWMKLAHFQEKNAELEAKLLDFENLKSDAMNRESDSKLRLQQQIGAIEKQKNEVEKQLSIMQHQLDFKESTERDLEREQNDHAATKKKLTLAQNELLSVQNLESEMRKDIQKLQASNDSLKQQNQVLKQDLETLFERTTAEKSNTESQWLQERGRLAERNQYLDGQVEKLNGKLRKAGQIHMAKKRNYAEKLAKLQQKSDSLEAKELELNVEKQNLDESVPLAAYNDVRQRLNKVEKRYRDLSEAKGREGSEKHHLRVESAASRDAPRYAEAEHLPEVAHHKSTTIVSPNKETEALERAYVEQTVNSNVDKMYMKELEHLKERLTRLSDVQKEQMKYFLGTEEAKDIGKILDCKDDVFMPRRMVDVTRDNVQNMTAQFEISDLEMTLT